MPAALIKFTQGATVGADGQALFGTTGTLVSIANAVNSGITSWKVELLSAPAGSALALGVVASSSNGTTPAATFTPDVRGPYRWRLSVWAGPSWIGDPIDIDIRVFSVKETNGLARPAPQLWPRPLPPLSSGEFGAKPDEHNFAGQGSGYAGTGADGQLDTLLRFASLAALGSVPTAADLTTLDETYLEQCAIRRVETYKDCFFLDRVTTRTAVPDVIIAAATPGHWWVRMLIPDPSWPLQGTWKIDPVNGSNEALGGTATPLKTRSEFFRRMKDATLTQHTNVTIASSLNAGDTYVATIHTSLSVDFLSDFVLNWVGVPTVLFTGTITAYTARNGATFQPTLMTVDAAGFVSWTASGLLDKVIEWTDGAGAIVRGVVAKDMGAKQAWISPPLNQNNNQTAVFAVGQTINVYDLPSIGVEVPCTEISDYKYLKATRWVITKGRAFCTSCSGFVSAFGGSFAWINCQSGTVDGFAVNVVGGHTTVSGGKNRFIVSDGGLFLKAHVLVTDSGLQVEGHGVISSGGQASGRADVEYLGTNATSRLCYLPVNQGGRIILGGYVYGSSVDTTVVQCDGRDGFVGMTNIPNITGASKVKFVLAGTTPDVSLLSAQELRDAFNNRVIGPFGPQ